MNTTDRRVKRTKKLLADALAALMKQKPLKSITVRELTELADLNRGTFYLHFKDVYDLAEQIENEIFDRLNEIIADFDSSKNETLEVMESSQTLRFFLTRLFELLADNADMAQSLIGVNGDPAFIKKLKSRLEQRSYSTLYNALPKDRRGDRAYLFSFIEYGSIGICETWLNSGMCETPGAMAEITEKFILGALGAFE